MERYLKKKYVWWIVHNECDLSLTYLVEEWLRDLLQSDSGDVLSSLPGTVSFSHQVISGPLVVHHRCSKNLNQMKHKRKFIKFLLSKTKIYLHPQQKNDIF